MKSRKLKLNKKTPNDVEGNIAVTSVDVLPDIKYAGKDKYGSRQWERIFNTTKNGMRIVDLQGGTEHVNDAFCRLVGVTRSETIGRNCYDCFAGNKCKSGDCPLERIKGGEDSMEHEAEWKRADGSKVTCIVTSTALRDNDGHLTGIVECFTDITNLKMTENKLRESEELHRITLSNISDSIFITDDNGYFTFVCPNSSVIFGYERSDIFKMRQIKNLLGDQLFDQDQLDELGELPNLECRVTDRFNVAHDLLITVKCVSIQGGTTLYSCRDITVRKRAEQKLHEAEAELKHTFEVVPHIIAKASVHTGYFTQCNPALTSILGFSAEEFLAKPLIEFVHPDDRQHTINEIEMQLEGSPVARFENRYICKDGSYKWLEWMATAADEKGLVYAAATDITERKQAERQVKQQQYYLAKAQEIGRIGTWELDLIENELNWTEETYRIFGIPVGTELSYEVFLEQVHPEDRTHVDQKMQAAIEGEPYDIEHRLLVDGEIKWVREKADLRFDENGQAVSAIGFTQDITERKQAESDLQKSNEALAAERSALEAKNIALNEVLSQIEAQRNQSGTHLQSNVNRIILPLLEIVREKLSSDEEHLINLLKSALGSLMEPTIGKLEHAHTNLSPRELEICNMIRQGFSSKQMASVFNVSIHTVNNQRFSIRKKLAINGDRINLENYLKTL